MIDDPHRTRRSLLAAAGTTAAMGMAGCAQITTPADVARATSPDGNVEYFVGVDWATDRADDLVMLDARQTRFYRNERTYGARRVPLEAITAVRDTDRGLAPDTNAYAETFGELGVTTEDDVLVYGSSVGARVARTVYALQVVGHHGNVYILNGGIDAWTGRIGTGRGGSADAVDYDPDPIDDFWVDREWLADRVGSFNEDGPGLIDVREPDAYVAAAGSSALDESHERHGHLPAAVNVHWFGNIEGGRLAFPGDLWQLYAGEAGLDEDGPVVVYGNENVDATQTLVTLRAIGFTDVRLYEGGFGEWANSGEGGRYPVETGTTAVIETEGDVGTSDGSDFTCN